MAAVSVVIPNYNGEAFLEECLNSLRQQTMQDYELIIVDNASKDNWLPIVNKIYPEAVIIKLDENYGFSRAVNEGIRAARAEYVFLLNNDTRLEPDCIEKLLTTAKSDRKIFSVNSKMLQMYKPELIDTAGDLYCALGWAFARGKDKDAKKYNSRDRIFSACAGAAMYRKEAFNVVGYFDEQHFSYLEDVDIGYRARINGYINIYEPTAVVYHVGSGVSGSRYNKFKISLAARNSVYVVYKNMPLLQIVINIPFLLVGFIVKALFFTRKKEGRTYIDGLIKGIKLCKTGKKYPFRIRNTVYYFKIQLELWKNIVLRFIGEL